MIGDISPRDMIRFGRYKRLLKFVMEARDANLPNAPVQANAGTI